MAKKKGKEVKGTVHEDLKGFNIRVDEFGVMQSNINVDTLNEFLNKNVVDKKLKNISEEE